MLDYSKKPKPRARDEPWLINYPKDRSEGLPLIEVSDIKTLTFDEWWDRCVKVT